MTLRTAFASFAVAATAAGVAAVPAQGALTPFVTCVARQDDGTGQRAYYGFRNNGATATIPFGSTTRTGTNNFSGDDDRGQGTVFPSDAGVPGFADDRTWFRVAVEFGTGTTANFGQGPTWRLAAPGQQPIPQATPIAPPPTGVIPSPTCDFDLTGRLTADRADVRPGQDIGWSIAVTNDGGTPFPVSQVSFANDGISQIFAPPGAPDELMPGETVVYPARTRVTPEQCYGTAVATVRLAFDPGGIIRTRESDPTNNDLRAEVPVICLTDVQVTTEAEAVSYAPGATAAYIVTVVNGGDAAVPVSSLRIRHSLAATLTPVGAAPAVLQPGEQLRLRGTASTAGAACGALTHSATVTLDDPTGRLVDGIANNNTWQSTVAIAGGSCAAATQDGGPSSAPPPSTTAGPRLQVAILGPRTGRIGRWATYTLRVRNRGTRAAQGLVVSFGLPKGSVLAQRLGPRDVRTGNLLHRRTSSLKPGGTFTTRVRVRFSTAKGNQRIFTVRAKGTNTTARSSRRIVTVRR